MPTRAKAPCSIPRCPGFATHRGRCADHYREADLARGTPAQRGYDEHWAEEIRIPFLKANPTCVDCGGPSEVPDHDPIPRRQLVAMGVEDPDAFEHLVPRCIPCHNSKTATTGR